MKLRIWSPTIFVVMVGLRRKAGKERCSALVWTLCTRTNWIPVTNFPIGFHPRESERESWNKDSVEGKSSNLHNTYDDNQQSWNEQPESRGFRNSIEQLQHLHTSTSRKKMKERKEKTRQPNKLGRRNKVEKFLSCLPGLWWRVMRSEMK